MKTTLAISINTLLVVVIGCSNIFSQCPSHYDFLPINENKDAIKENKVKLQLELFYDLDDKVTRNEVDVPTDIEVSYYDTSGLVTKEVCWYEDGNYERLYKYDKFGRLIERLVTSTYRDTLLTNIIFNDSLNYELYEEFTNGKRQQINIYKYDTLCRLIEEIHFDNDSVMSYDYKYVYDKYGNSVSEEHIYYGLYSYKYHIEKFHIENICSYSEKGILVSKSVYYEPGVISEKIDYKYNKNDRLIEENSINPGSNSWHTKQYKYEKGKLKSYKYKSHFKKETEEYSYNKNNLLETLSMEHQEKRFNSRYLYKYFYQYFEN